jgi:hypothetical protein
MIERKRYLELCRKNSVSPNSVNLIYQGSKYYPLALKIWFDGNGKTRNTAEMVDCVSRTKLYCDVKDVSE